jgi:translation initiation factor IF-1
VHGEKKEIILLDARLLNLIDTAAFLAELENGHQVVAYLPGPDRERAQSLRPGDVVQVRFSPFDMSRGRIIPPGRTESHESTSVG